VPENEPALKNIIRIGIDAGGTFTDFVTLYDDGSLETFKLRSNPLAPEQVILQGLRRVSAQSPAAALAQSTWFTALRSQPMRCSNVRARERPS
jgi:N-methylhydantoinase A/oxoprolinase/acetone carboxylase beta subunit